jgi:hypothetical protein
MANLRPQQPWGRNWATLRKSRIFVFFRLLLELELKLKLKLKLTLLLSFKQDTYGYALGSL